MTLSPHRQGLKDLADFTIDAQFVQRYGGAVFNTQGEPNPEYENVCTQLSAVIADALADLKSIQSQIPTF
jgi:hypothetical protein